MHSTMTRQFTEVLFYQRPCNYAYGCSSQNESTCFTGLWHPVVSRAYFVRIPSLSRWRSSDRCHERWKTDSRVISCSKTQPVLSCQVSMPLERHPSEASKARLRVFHEFSKNPCLAAKKRSFRARTKNQLTAVLFMPLDQRSLLSCTCALPSQRRSTMEMMQTLGSGTCTKSCTRGVTFMSRWIWWSVKGCDSRACSKETCMAIDSSGFSCLPFGKTPREECSATRQDVNSSSPSSYFRHTSKNRSAMAASLKLCFSIAARTTPVAKSLAQYCSSWSSPGVWSFL